MTWNDTVIINKKKKKSGKFGKAKKEGGDTYLQVLSIQIASFNLQFSQLL